MYAAGVDSVGPCCGGPRCRSSSASTVSLHSQVQIPSILPMLDVDDEDQLQTIELNPPKRSKGR